MTIVLTRAARAVVLGVLLVVAACAVPAESAPPPLRVMTLGDSITNGGSASDHQGYRTALGARLARAGVAVRWSNRGVNGFTTQGLLEHVDGWLAEDHPDVVLLAIGTNDNLDPADVPQTAHRLSDLLDRILASSPDVRVVMAQVAVSRQPERAARERYVNSQISAVVATRGPRVTPADLTGIPATPEYSVDGVHPNDAGYALMAYQWYLALVPVLYLPAPTDDPWRGVPRVVPTS